MRPELCIVCNDAKSFASKVNDARRIGNSLKDLLARYDDLVDDKNTREDNHLSMLLSSDSRHQHFMCGSCYKVNEMDLKNAEKTIVNELIIFCKLLKNDLLGEDTERIYHKILINLRGDYSKMYRDIERFYYVTRKNNK